MASKEGGMAFSRKSYKLTSDAEKSRVTGLVHEKLLNDYLHRVFSSPDHGPAAATSRKPLNFQNLPEHLDQLLHVDEEEEEESQEQVEGRLGPSTVVLDHTGGFEGLLLVDDDLLGVIGHSNFGTIRSTTCVYKGKWIYEVLISSQGLMQIGWCTINCRFNQEEGVGDTHNSYAYDGNRVRKWNVTTTNYGKAWAAGDIVSCLIDLDEGTLSFSLNGVSLGTAFENLSRGLGMAYFPAISLSFKESVAFNFGSRPLRYPFWQATGPCRTRRAPTWLGHRGCWAASGPCSAWSWTPWKGGWWRRRALSGSCRASPPSSSPWPTYSITSHRSCARCTWWRPCS
ncbi:unnamed protein product [Rangifer tarandus platyrhynchus]|uniref:Uncharacterized protein n=1 Tax=Rangifer tarandus platyrhynchus TaxID=3082113 RepID=A0AC59YPC2_RANTA